MVRTWRGRIEKTVPVVFPAMTSLPRSPLRYCPSLYGVFSRDYLNPTGCNRVRLPEMRLPLALLLRKSELQNRATLTTFSGFNGGTNDWCSAVVHPGLQGLKALATANVLRSHKIIERGGIRFGLFGIMGIDSSSSRSIPARSCFRTRLKQHAEWRSSSEPKAQT